MRRVLRIISILCFLTSAYLFWAAERVDRGTLLAEGSAWPRAAPYPDRWLLALNDYFDRRYPGPAGTIKMYSELDRVGFVVWAASCVVGSLGAVLIVPDAVRLFRGRNRWRGFSVE